MGLLCNFIGHLFTQKFAPSTIASHISAISYVHKIANVEDPSQSFLVKKVLKGTQNMSKSCDSRLPITSPILTKVLSALDSTVSNPFNRTMLKAFYLLAFHAFMRLGELAVRSPQQVDKVLQRIDVSFPSSDNCQLILRHFKNMKDNQPLTINLSANKTCKYCPVHALQAYLLKSKHEKGPLFTFESGIPVSHNYVSSQLRNAISFTGLDPKLYKGHSIRIGAATEAAKRGMSENEIQEIGRWKSNAHRRYVRIHAFSF